MEIEIPEGERGEWRIENFEVTEAQASRYNINCHGRPMFAGRYQRLMRGRAVVMSNTPQELNDHKPLIRNAKGHVLVNGLGLGIIASQVVVNEEVEHITIIEISEDVISLVAPTLQGRLDLDDKITIIHADAFTYKPPKGIRYGAVWHDIWDAICSDNLEGMKKLHRKYGRLCDWQGSWCRDACRRLL